MKKLFLVLAITTFSSCSFDNKTGIWQDATDIPVNNQVTKTITDSEPEQRYEDIFIKDETLKQLLFLWLKLKKKKKSQIGFRNMLRLLIMFLITLIAPIKYYYIKVLN